MNRDEIKSAAALVTDADTSYKDSRDWYDSYGWHLTTEDAGDVCLQAVEYDWLDGTDQDAVRKLLVADSDLTDDEAESIVERAREVRDAAESLCGLLAAAVTAYEDGDLEWCRAALLAAYDQESDHGDAPAAQSLAGQILRQRLPRGKYRIKRHDLDGRGAKACRVYELESVACDYWAAVTDVECPCCDGGTVRWAEAGYVRGYRICDGCGRHYLAGGGAKAPTLILIGGRKN